MLNCVLNDLHVTKSDIAMVGDRMVTDISFVSAENIQSFLVLSGIDVVEDTLKYPEDRRPTHIMPSLVEVADYLESIAKPSK